MDAQQQEVMEEIVRKWFLEHFHAPKGIMMYEVLAEMSKTMNGSQIEKCLPYIFSGGIVVQAEKKREPEEDAEEKYEEDAEEKYHKRLRVEGCASRSGNQEAHYGCCITAPGDEEDEEDEEEDSCPTTQEVIQEIEDTRAGPADPPATSPSPSSQAE